MAKPNATEGLSASEELANACNQQDNDGRRTPDSSLLYLSAHNVYYVKYGGFALKFMSPSLSGTYR